MSTAYLLLENGQIFCGKYFGRENAEVVGELVFTTGMTGYLKTLTDPSYFGQIVVQTFPLIGNYGVIPSDFESKLIGPSAYIVKEWCHEPSNFRCEGDLDAFLKSKNITGVYGIDTRALTKVIRQNGVMNGKIMSTLSDESLEEIKKYKIQNALNNVSTKEKYVVQPAEKKYIVALLDFGCKANIISCLVDRDCEVVVYPHDASPEEILSSKPDGILLSNGPADPSENVDVIENVKKLLKLNIPIFGICLGHQIMALAHGFKTHKMKYGHRGANQPVKENATGNVYITSQNHGYAVTTESINPDIADAFFTNVNDGTNEGITYKSRPFFSVQFHPEACSGPHDAEFLFDKFIEEINNSL